MAVNQVEEFIDEEQLQQAEASPVSALSQRMPVTKAPKQAMAQTQAAAKLSVDQVIANVLKKAKAKAPAAAHAPKPAAQKPQMAALKPHPAPTKAATSPTQEMKAFVAKRAASVQPTKKTVAKPAAHKPVAKKQALSQSKLDAIKQKVVAATLTKLKAKKTKGKAVVKPQSTAQVKRASLSAPIKTITHAAKAPMKQL